MIYLTYLAVAFLFIGYVLNIRKNKWCWLFWYVCSLIWAGYALTTGQWSLFYNNLICLCFTVWGAVRWHSDES